MKQKRVQLSRRRGWRMPINTVKIDRSTKWGNPFRLGHSAIHPRSGKTVTVDSKDAAISLFELHLRTKEGAGVVAAAQIELRGKNLACWCKEGHHCHGDVLLAVANIPMARAA
jgi:Domain of unknown function (DUF4326)